MQSEVNRREFIRNSAIAGIGMAVLPSALSATGMKTKVRLGLIAVGRRGQVHVAELLNRTDVEIVAMADPDTQMMAKTRALISAAGKKLPAEYAKGNDDYRNLLKRDDVDAVLISSPWELHFEHCVESMRAGKPVGLEVGGGLTLQECRDYVQAYEQTRVPVMILENACYRRDLMAITNMVRKGLFGELLHLQGGYQHDMRARKFNNGTVPDTPGIEFGPGTPSTPGWRTQHSVNRNGDLYPTHSLGPLAVMLDINRGNRITALSSVATKSRGLHRYIMNNIPAGQKHRNADVQFKLGDIVTTTLQTANGETIVLTHDTSSPRPYNLGFRVQGTAGLWQESGGGEFADGLLYLEGASPAKKWESPSPHLQANDHSLWKVFGRQAESAGHGGMDFFILHAFIECIKQGKDFPLDVYDLATWHAITPLSETSIAQGGQLQLVPDFTNGAWQRRKPVFGLNSEY
ncbi:Gfo/Idh/MocA family oxidoreductase [Terrimonas sp. NA20]|uniref:Gfo/Idh/MocA family oxidoreductase n=1 Tax=Terrimonas ginsenosidimutans TaxID=2908004 RepID=A0ABS9KT16_9BACT|nr:Gfo/Idh/MocA family oxidoreductase [Terrimonas ginsenosidimutans]MCG2615446.1 Gfo/Idh/MocA family oxidoreductase [Terrimonas ginsenosidimutans]